MKREIHDLEVKNMLRMANDAMSRAYAPYSNFTVGACLKSGSGAYYLGANIENAAFSPSICAERLVFAKAVYERERVFEVLAIVSSGDKQIKPCGVCLQMMAEFCDGDLQIICANRTGRYDIYSLSELLPYAFGAEAMH